MRVNVVALGIVRTKTEQRFQMPTKVPRANQTESHKTLNNVRQEARKQGPLIALFVALLGLVIGQASIFAILPPLGRLFGMSDVEIGAIVTISSFVAFLTTKWWGRQLHRHGAKAVLTMGLVGSCATLYGMAYLAHLGMTGKLEGSGLFLTIFIIRGILFGLFLSAVIVATYAAVTRIAPSGQERVRAFALIQSANGAGKIVGPLIAGALATVGLVFSLAVVPVLPLAGLVLVWVLWPASATMKASQAATPIRTLSWRDARLWPSLLVIVLVLMPLAVSQITLGFVVQDRLGIPEGEQAAKVSGLALFTVFASLTAAQLLLMRVLRLPPRTWIWGGCAAAALGLLALAFSNNVVWLFVGLVSLGLGCGTSQAAALAIPSMIVQSEEQSAAASLTAAANTLAFSIGPIAGSILYSWRSPAPYVGAAILVLGCIIFIFANRGLRALAQLD